MTLKRLRYWLWGSVVVLGLAVTIAALFVRTPWGGVAFSLVDHTGAPFTEEEFEGHPVMLYFGFTHCPEVCPTTLFEMASWLEVLGEEGLPLKAAFVSVDPERDDPDIMKEYVTVFSDRITGVTGDPAEIRKLTESWHVYAEKIPLEDGDYTVDHTASVFLIGRDGSFQGTIAYRENHEVALQKLRSLLEKW